MSEFWVSKKKYFCKYCEIYIADDVPSRQQHESGLKHKGNKDRFIRDLYKSGEKKKKDKAEEEREMKMIEQAAQAAFAKDVGHAAASQLASTSAPKPPPATKPAVKSGNKWTNYTSAADLGIGDAEAERAAAEAAKRQQEGTVGDWTTVSVSTPPVPPEDAIAGSSTTKRPREPTPDEDDDARKFKARQRTAPVGLGQDLYDPGEIRIKKREDLAAPPKKEEDPDLAALIPEWRPTQWRRAGEEVKVEDGPSAGRLESQEDAALSIPAPPDEAPPLSVKVEEETEAKPSLLASEPALSSEVPSLFKKRKMKSATAGGRKPLKA